MTVELGIHDDFTREAVVLFWPDLVIAPFLKRPIPADVWRGTLCLIVHPGIRGDRGPRLGDPRRRSGLGRHTDRGAERDGCGARLGLGGIPMRPARKTSLPTKFQPKRVMTLLGALGLAQVTDAEYWFLAAPP